MEPIKVKVNKKHFDAAVKYCTKGDRPIMDGCLVAQAIKSLYPRKKVSVSNFSASVGTKQFKLSAEGQKLITQFDALSFYEASAVEKRRYLKVRNRLPLTLILTPEA